jgi:dienelactone hydrolase
MKAIAMNRRLTIASLGLVFALFCFPAFAQSTNKTQSKDKEKVFEVARKTFSWTNQSTLDSKAQGSKSLRSLVFYPTDKKGSKIIAKKPTGGFPVVVFLHGWGGPAFAYPALGQELAKHGYITILSDTAWTNAELQRKDGHALYAAIKHENENKKSMWFEAMNLSKVGLSGHSMGGGSTAHVLAKNPGYKAGFCFAPWAGGLPFSSDASQIEVPVGIVHGEGDTKLKWKETGGKLFKALPGKLKGKFLYLLNTKATHQNVARLGWRGKDKNKPIFDCTMKLCISFFDKHLKGEGVKLDQLLKNTDKEANLVKIFQ